MPVDSERDKQAHREHQTRGVGVGKGRRQPPEALGRHCEGEPSPDQAGEAHQGSRGTETGDGQARELPGRSTKGTNDRIGTRTGEAARSEGKNGAQ